MHTQVAAPDHLRKVVAILAGLTSYELDLMRRILTVADSRSTHDLDISSLSGRERQVLDAMLAQKATKVIGADLGISHRTVEKYRSNVLEKLGYRSTLELVAAAGSLSRSTQTNE